MAIARFNSDGTLDTTFDTDGKVRIDFSAFADDARAVLVLAGAFTTGASSINNGDTVQVRHTSSASFSTATNTTLTADTTPDAFTFTDQTGALRATVVISNNATISGINAAAAIGIVGGEYCINGGAFTSAAGTVTTGTTVRVLLTASASYNTRLTTTRTVGGRQGDVSANKTGIAQQITAVTGDAITSISLDGTDFSCHLRVGYTFNRWF